jgi:hypothetical protein
MRAILNKITTDAEGESKITFCVPSNELASVMLLHQHFEKELVLEISDAPPAPKINTVPSDVAQVEREPRI